MSQEDEFRGERDLKCGKCVSMCGSVWEEEGDFESGCPPSPRLIGVVEKEYFRGGQFNSSSQRLEI